uniref:Uncharacterized protein n=1 Tax=Steinernema glaseri TaxID=37863 RepID=A0A1I7YLF4_9BILA
MLVGSRPGNVPTESKFIRGIAEAPVLLGTSSGQGPFPLRIDGVSSQNLVNVYHNANKQVGSSRFRSEECSLANDIWERELLPALDFEKVRVGKVPPRSERLALLKKETLVFCMANPLKLVQFPVLHLHQENEEVEPRKAAGFHVYRKSQKSSPHRNIPILPPARN